MGLGTSPSEGLAVAMDGGMKPSEEGKIGAGWCSFDCAKCDSRGKIDVRQSAQYAWTRTLRGEYNRGLSMPQTDLFQFI